MHLFLVAGVVASAGTALFLGSLTGAVVPRWPPDVGLSGALWLAAYPVQADALGLLARRRAGSQVNAVTLDALAMTTATALASYLFFVEPLLTTPAIAVIRPDVPPAEKVAMLVATAICAGLVLARFMMAVRELSEPMPFGGEQLSVGVSIGIAHDPRAGAGPAIPLRTADEAMYQAKQADRGRWVLAGAPEVHERGGPVIDPPAPLRRTPTRA